MYLPHINLFIEWKLHYRPSVLYSIARQSRADKPMQLFSRYREAIQLVAHAYRLQCHVIQRYRCLIISQLLRNGCHEENMARLTICTDLFSVFITTTKTTLLYLLWTDSKCHICKQTETLASIVDHFCNSEFGKRYYKINIFKCNSV